MPYLDKLVVKSCGSDIVMERSVHIGQREYFLLE